MEKDAFLAEVASAPRVGGTDQTNIAHVVEKHIPPGTDLKNALRFLGERGFKIFPYKGKNVPLGQEWFLADKDESYRVILTERTRVIIESDGNKVLNSRGWIFLMGL